MILENMKTIEEVIKNKSRLIKGKERNYSFMERILQNPITGKPIYLVDNLNDKTIIELIKEITPLIYYLISSLKNEEEEDENLLRELIIELEFPPCESKVEVSGRFKIDYENPLNSIKKCIKDIEDEGYFLTFTHHFNLLFLLKSQILGPLREESEEEREEKKINTSKSFKSDDCVICMDTPPNILLCNCGHICIFEKCIEIKQFDQCPICKTDITILRIIE